MSRWVVSKLCLRNILFGCFLCSVLLLVLFLNRPSSLNDDVSTVLAEPRRTELMAAEIHQLERQNLLLKKCRDILTKVAANNNQTKRITPVRFRVEDRHRVLFCFVPKVASRNLVRLMLILAGVVETNDLSAVPKPKVFAENPMPILYAKTLNDTVKNGTGNFTKFIFVRHPFERLVSAYQDKLGINNLMYHKILGTVIVRKFRKNPSRLSLEMGNDVTFPEFVTFIIDEWRKGENPLDIHWRPIFDLCLPCEMQFDFIGKFETLNRDVDYLLRKLNETDLVGLFTGQPKAQTTSSLWKESMNQISHQQLSELNQMYANDFRLFGYPHYNNGKESLH